MWTVDAGVSINLCPRLLKLLPTGITLRLSLLHDDATEQQLETLEEMVSPKSGGD